MTTLGIVSILCIGPLIGVEFAVSAFINPVMRRLDDAAQAAAVRMFARRLGAAMPYWYGVGLVLLLVETFLRRAQPGFSVLVGASSLWAAVVVFSVLFLVPINNRMMRLDPGAFSQAAQSEHRRWNTLHQLRIAALIVSFTLFLSTVVR